MGDERFDEPPGSRNWFGGQADMVWQGRDVFGGVHFHGSTSPPRSPVVRSQLLPVPAHYTNYERPLRELDEWLTGAADGPRVAVLRGPPGSGKTTLACHWAQRQRDGFTDGHFFLRLTGSPDEAEQERPALEQLLQDVGFTADEIPASLEGRSARWRSWSEAKRIVLVVDDALTVGQVMTLLPGTGPSAVLVTEGGPLGMLRGRASVRFVDLTPMSDAAARELLGRMVVGQERLDAEPASVDELVEICEGSALALCVVGSLLADMPGRPVARLVGRLREEGRILRELSPDDDLSLTVVFDAAYRRLPPLAQRCYQVLGAHPGSGDVSADAVAVALGAPRDEVAEALARVARAWLVQEVGDDRYRASGLVRHHARAKAEAAPDVAGQVRRALLAYYWARAMSAERLIVPGRGWREQIWPELDPPVDGSTVDDAWAWLVAERRNLRAVVELAWSLEEHRLVAQLCLALWPLHEQRKHPHDMAATNRLGVAAAEADRDELAAAVLGLQLGFAHRQLGDVDKAAEVFAAALATAERIGSTPAIASALESLGLVRSDQGRQGEAAELLRRNLALAAELQVPRRLALARFHLARVEAPGRALALLDDARDAFAGMGGEGYNLAKVELWRGRKLTEAGRLDEASQTLAEAAAAADVGTWHVERAQTSEALADLAQARGDRALALSHLEDALAIYRHHFLTAQVSAVERRLASSGAGG